MCEKGKYYLFQYRPTTYTVSNLEGKCVEVFKHGFYIKPKKFFIGKKYVPKDDIIGEIEPPWYDR